MRKANLTILGCIVLLAATMGSAQAGLILDFSGGTTMFGGGDFTAGFTFSVTDPVTVDGLAWWDEGGDGLNNSHDVGLWTSGGSLLVSATVSNASSAVEASTSGFGNWLVTAIPSLTLNIGDYVLGGVQTNSIGGDPFRLLATAIPIPGIIFGDVTQNVGNGLTLTRPDDILSSLNDGAWGPNLRLASTNSVPEPASLALLGLGLAGLGFTRRRKRA